MAVASKSVQHGERHSTSTETVRDIVIGMSDGLTVPFALAAGLSGAVHTLHIIVIGGLAEIAAGSIAMGLGGYLAARTDAEHYIAELRREQREVDGKPEAESEEVRAVLVGYGVQPETARQATAEITGDRQTWIDFMMRFELGLEEPDPRRAPRSALVIAASYIVGGLVPLLPYMVASQVAVALKISIGVTLAALFIFGYVKARVSGAAPLRGSVQTVLVGGAAATAAFGIARLISA